MPSSPRQTPQRSAVAPCRPAFLLVGADWLFSSPSFLTVGRKVQGHPKATQSSCWRRNRSGWRGRSGCWGSRFFSAALLITILRLSPERLIFFATKVSSLPYFFTLQGVVYFLTCQDVVCLSCSVTHPSVQPAHTNMHWSASQLQGKLSQWSHNPSDATHHDFKFLNRAFFIYPLIRWSCLCKGKRI